MPLGIRGEWEWMRLAEGVRPPWDWFALAAAGVAVYAGARRRSAGDRCMRRSSRWAEARWLAVLFAASIGVQVAVPLGAPDEHDLTKWAYVNYLQRSTGYFKIARQTAAHDPWRVPRAVSGLDPRPGLVAHRHASAWLDRRPVHPAAHDGAKPGSCRFLSEHMPPSVQVGFRQLEGMDRRPILRSERAALYATALLTLLACAGRSYRSTCWRGPRCPHRRRGPLRPCGRWHRPRTCSSRSPTRPIPCCRRWPGPWPHGLAAGSKARSSGHDESASCTGRFRAS